MLWTGVGGSPWPLVVKRLCERFHCLPGALYGEDYAEIMQIIALDNLEIEIARRG